MGFGFMAQQRVGVSDGAMGIVSELDAAEITLCPFLVFLGLTNSFAKS